jgi:hypothetical protein
LPPPTDSRVEPAQGHGAAPGTRTTRAHRPPPKKASKRRRIVALHHVSETCWSLPGRLLAPHELGSVNAAAAELGATWPSLRKAFTRHGLGMPTPSPKPSASATIAAAHQRTGQPARPVWTRCLWRSTLAPSRPDSGHGLSYMRGSAARSSTPSWAPTWWSSCTAKAAGLVLVVLGRGRRFRRDPARRQVTDRRAGPGRQGPTGPRRAGSARPGGRWRRPGPGCRRRRSGRPGRARSSS